MNKYQTNPLKTRADLVRLAVDLVEPLLPCLSEGRARLHIGDTGAVYDEAIAGMEGFSRVLWALVPMLAGRCPEAEPLWALWREGIVNGVDPDHPEYWGDIGPFDQRMVEMAVMGMALCMVPERFYHELPEAARGNLYRWLNQINQYDMPRNNWLFFRVLVNCGFLSVGLPADEKRLADDLDSLETHYCGDGWYYDKPAQRDYYTLWAFHYYGLVYARFMSGRDPARAARFIDRARQIAPRFAAWFDGEGRALPYGRSLTYRFAQGAFWSACALSGVTADGLGWGAVKGLLLRNLRWWMKQPIFDRDGILTIGYGYPNLVFAEGYNAPGSPYWAMKVFAVLALPEDHPFWQAEEEAYAPPRVLLDEQARLLLTRDAENRSVIAYTAGNHAYEHAHEDEKYEKFAYSTHFAFSAAKEAGTLKKGAFDSMLALRGERGLWHGRSGFDRFELAQTEVSFAWRPMDGVEVETRLIPWENWHLRCHTVRTDRPLEAAEGGFAVCRDFPGARPCDRVRSAAEADENRAAVRCERGSCAIFAIDGYAGGEVVEAEPNTSLAYPRTLIPTLRAKLSPGVTRLVCAVCATEDGSLPETIPQEVTRLAQQCLLRTAAHAKRVGGSAALASEGCARAGRVAAPHFHITASSVMRRRAATARDALRRAIEKYRATAPLAADSGMLPYRGGERWLASPFDGDSWWTGGFWPGLMWQLWAASERVASPSGRREAVGALSERPRAIGKDDWFRDEALRAEARLTEQFRAFERLNHDVGFMYLLSCGAHHKLLGDEQARVDTLHAASLLMGRFNPAGFIRAWNEPERVGYVIIDCMMNLSLLFWASAETGDPRFARVARIHADTTLRNFLRADGSVCHIVEFDPDTGARLREHGGQGYAEGTAWSRGQAWGLYGFALAYANTGERRYLDAAQRIAAFFMAHIRPDGLTDCDFRQPPEPGRIDNIAGACAACGLIELHRLTGQGDYLEAAGRLLDGLIDHCCDWSPDTCGILTHCTASYHDDAAGVHTNIVYGDYFLVEALARLAGTDPGLWRA